MTKKTTRRRSRGGLLSSPPAKAPWPSSSSSEAATTTTLRISVRQLQQHDEAIPTEGEISLRLLRQYASSVSHQQFHGTDIITVRVDPPGAR